MGSLPCGQRLRVVSRNALSSLLLLCLLPLVWSLPACGGHKPAGASVLPVSITLTPSTSLSLQLGTVQQFTASAVNNANAHINPTFTYSVVPGPNQPSGVL